MPSTGVSTDYPSHVKSIVLFRAVLPTPTKDTTGRNLCGEAQVESRQVHQVSPMMKDISNLAFRREK